MVGRARRLQMPRPVRPPEHTGQNGPYQFCSSTYVPLLFDKACVPKNTPLDQNYLRTMINNTSVIFFATGKKKFISHVLLFFKLMMKQLAFGLQTFFVTTGFVGSTSTCCSIDSCLRKRCSLHF